MFTLLCSLNDASFAVLRHLDVMELFLLPKTLRCLVVSLLLSAVKIDKDVGQVGMSRCLKDFLVLYGGPPPSYGTPLSSNSRL